VSTEAVTYWDDIDLLRVIDELEQKGQTGSLFDGHRLMEAAARGKQLDWQRNPSPFARELVLARNSGYLEYDDQTWYGQPLADPARDPQTWLQQIREIHLTIAGRDRARGRIVMQPTPVSNEDDGHPISQLTLGEIAKAVAEHYDLSELRAFLGESGIPDEFIATATTDDGPRYVLDVLSSLLGAGSAARRALRTFIASWLTDRLLVGPSDDTRTKVTRELARQGWHIRGDRLVVGPRQSTSPEPSAEPESAQICLNGHAINFHVQARPDWSKDFCQNCGERTIVACPTCGKSIPGQDTVVHAYCQYCGAAYPWTEKAARAAKELVHQQGLAEAEEVLVVESIDDLLQMTPASPAAAERVRQFVKKAGPQVGESLRAILVDVVSESVKKIIWPAP